MAERGPLSVVDLLKSTPATLSDLLYSLRDLKDFRLIEYATDGDVIRLTRAGSAMTNVTEAEAIQTSATALLNQ